jgi:hypothetical protein
MIALGIGTTASYALLPATNIDPASIPAPGTLAGATSLDAVGERFYQGNQPGARH